MDGAAPPVFRAGTMLQCTDALCGFGDARTRGAAAHDQRAEEPLTDEWVQAWNCQWLHEAEFIKSLLEAEGIDVMIPDEHLVGIQPLYANAIGGIRVLVHSSDAARAADVLRAVDSE